MKVAVVQARARRRSRRAVVPMQPPQKASTWQEGVRVRHTSNVVQGPDSARQQQQRLQQQQRQRRQQQRPPPGWPRRHTRTRPGSSARRMAGYLKRRIVPKSSSSL